MTSAPGVEAYLLLHSLRRLHKTERLFHPFIGFGILFPTLLVLGLLTFSWLSGEEVYIRRTEDSMVCFLTPNFPFNIIHLVPVGLVLGFNVTATIVAVSQAYSSAKFRWAADMALCSDLLLSRNVSRSERLLAAMRNTLILTSVLGLGFLLGLLPANMIQQYVFIIINGLAGVFILFSTVLLNKNIILPLPSGRSSNRSIPLSFL